jgi:tRNA A37 N6-isopentenylltransferase MiaA
VLAAMERLKVMRNLCEVLGIDFWEKMEELDIDPKVEEMDDETSQRVNLAVELLENTKRSRFLKEARSRKKNCFFQRLRCLVYGVSCNGGFGGSCDL